MLAALALASSLWLAGQEAGARAPIACQAIEHGKCVDEAGKAVVPVEKIADEFGRDLYWLIGSNAADLYTTAWAIKRCAGCDESNPFGPTAEARIALKMAGAASTGLTLWKLRRDGHARAATILRWTSVAVNAAFVVNNTVHAVRRK